METYFPKIVNNNICLSNSKFQKIFLNKKHVRSLERNKAIKSKYTDLKKTSPISLTIKNKNSTLNSCIICFETITNERKHYLHCGHVFHCECINKWFQIKNDGKCPICKENIRHDNNLRNNSNSSSNFNTINSSIFWIFCFIYFEEIISIVYKLMFEIILRLLKHFKLVMGLLYLFIIVKYF